MSLPALALLDVVWPRDALTYPPTWKMWACVSPRRLWFLRINTEGGAPGSVRLARADHPFLAHDSYLGCHGDLIEVDEETLRSALVAQARADRRGIIGKINPALRPTIREAIAQSSRLSGRQIAAIIAELDAADAA